MMKKLFLVSALMLTACGDSAYNKAAEEYVGYANWPLQKMFEASLNKLDTDIQPALKDPKSCPHRHALETQEWLKKSRKELAEYNENVIESIKLSFTEEELQEINKFYTDTKIGRFLANEKGVEEMQEFVNKSKFRKQAAKEINALPTLNLRIYVLADYAIQLLSAEERAEFDKFNSSATGKKLQKKWPEISEKTSGKLTILLDNASQFGQRITLDIKRDCADEEPATKAEKKPK